MTAPLEVRTKDKQHSIVHYLVSEGMKEAEVLQQLDATVYHNEVCMTGSKCLKATKPVSLCCWWRQVITPIHIHKRTKHGACSNNYSLKLWSNYYGNCINVARPWCKPLVQQPSLYHNHSAQMGNWITFTACCWLTLSYCMTRPQQCCQSHNENIPILHLLF
jgi:hypothetical protein